MSAAAGRHSPREMAQSFALTLVPIAIAYHLAHYLAYLLTQGQYVGCRPYRRRLPRRCQGTPDSRGSARGAALAGAADRADGGLHLREPLHSVRAHCRAPPARAAEDGGAGVAEHARRRTPSRARHRSVAVGRARPLRAFEIDLPRARLRLSRRYADDGRRSPLSPIAGRFAETRRRSTTRRLRRRRRRCGSGSRACGWPGSTRPRNRSGSAT
jgi:hypothetical protein